MSRRDFTRLPRLAKPEKPHPDFPLFPHDNGCWAKKVKGKLHYFGAWDDPDAALAKWLSEKDDLLAGRTPREAPEALTVGTLCGTFLSSKQNLLDAGELSHLTFAEHAECCKRIVDAFGKRRLVSDLRPADFETLRLGMAKQWGPVRRGKFVNLTKSVFGYAFRNGMTDRPMTFGDTFRKPSQKTILLHRHAKGPRLFEAAEIRALLDAATPPMRAMILLGANCGFGNTDCGRLPMSTLDLTGGWVNYPRPKTGVSRRCPLWPETVAAINDWLAVRPEPADPADAELVFITSKHGRWSKRTTNANPICMEMRKLMKRVGVNGNRSFYTLRHVLQTIGDESGDFVAVKTIMGHSFAKDISSVYRERISDQRLRKVVGVVRDWLFGDVA
jgi:integrase